MSTAALTTPHEALLARLREGKRRADERRRRENAEAKREFLAWLSAERKAHQRLDILRAEFGADVAITREAAAEYADVLRRAPRQLPPDSAWEES